ncbi:MAG: 4-(cytidine 5'-diphospho)-2-C-methyl-D-erythritol kinase [Alphaproteobacteria bacterium]
MQRIRETALAKVNLDLRVCHRREDGYHELDSVVAFADIGDQLTFEPADGLSLEIEGPFGDALPPRDDNLVLRAARALAGKAGREPDVRITLEKILPVASGLGGGSADAAAALRGLVRLWALPFASADILPLARELGADVPVCLASNAARMQGIGERLTSVAMPADIPMVLVNPGQAVSTAEVFRGLTDFSGRRDQTSFEALEQGFHAHLIASVNDLEAPAIRIEPAIGAVLDALRDQSGCALARMSGSGATCFGLFASLGERDQAVAQIAASEPTWWVIGTVAR